MRAVGNVHKSVFDSAKFKWIPINIHALGLADGIKGKRLDFELLWEKSVNERRARVSCSTRIKSAEISRYSADFLSKWFSRFKTPQIKHFSYFIQNYRMQTHKFYILSNPWNHNLCLVSYCTVWKPVQIRFWFLFLSR